MLQVSSRGAATFLDPPANVQVGYDTVQLIQPWERRAHTYSVSSRSMAIGIRWY
jgi:hypothetical protein